MRKESAGIQTVNQFFAQIKQYMKANSTSRIAIKLLKQSYHTQEDSSIAKIIQFLNAKTSFNKSFSGEQIVQFFNSKLSQARGMTDKFKIQPEYIHYISKYNNIRDDKTLLKQIQANPEGLLIDDELIKFSNSSNIKSDITKLIYRKQAIPVKSKGIQKSKIKENSYYEGYLLFPIPHEIKQFYGQLFKISNQKQINELQSQQQKNLADRQRKIQRIFSTKTSTFRPDFINICSANISKAQNKSNLNQNSQAFQKIYQSWDQKNKRSVPNFQRQAEQWFKSRK